MTSNEVCKFLETEKDLSPEQIALLKNSMNRFCLNHCPEFVSKPDPIPDYSWIDKKPVVKQPRKKAVRKKKVQKK